MRFGILNCLGVNHKRDGQTDTTAVSNSVV